jgi:hypothetical protein
MGDLLFASFCEGLKTKGIHQVQNFGNDKIYSDRNISEGDALEQIKIMSEFHSLLIGYEGFIGKRLDNYTGKKVEQYKIYIKKIKRDIKKLKAAGPKNLFEERLLECGDNFIERSEACISEIYNADYYGLISRSMKRTEICIGNTSLSNLRKKETIEIIDLSHCSYNMVECDVLYLLSKLKRAGTNLNWTGLIEEFCRVEKLDSNSLRFVTAMLSYPQEFMKCCNRYRYAKKDWSDEEYEIKLVKAIEKDGNSLICY